MKDKLASFVHFFRRTELWIPVLISLGLAATIWITISLMQYQSPVLTTFVLPDPEDVRKEEQEEVAAHRDEIMESLRAIHREAAYCMGGFDLAMNVASEDTASESQAYVSAAEDCSASQKRLEKMDLPVLNSANVSQKLSDASLYCLTAIEHANARLAAADSVAPQRAPDTHDRQRDDCLSALWSAGRAAGLSDSQLDFLSVDGSDSAEAKQQD